MAARSSADWYPTAAYLYVLHLDGPALAWEYLRRNPDYGRAWLRHRREPAAGQVWGLRLLEDPTLDARDAHPVWFPDPDDVLQLYRDADPPPDAEVFAFWRIPGRKHLTHDGTRLVLVSDWPGHRLRFALAPDLADGMAYVYAIRARTARCRRLRTVATQLDTLMGVEDAAPVAMTGPRPTPSVLLELRTLQALDATLAGASLREVAVGLFGSATVAAGWYADGGLRSRVRRLVRRGRSLMRSDYRRLARLE